MSVYYLDTSTAFVEFYRSRADAAWVSSALLRIELVRAVRRRSPDLLSEAERILAAFAYMPISEAVVLAATGEPDRGLRALDAIHLASARMFAADLDALVTYDRRLAAAAADAGLPVAAPGVAGPPNSG